MELQAAISALRDLAPQAKDEGGLIVYSDSLYIVNCFADRWYINWRKHGWVKTYNGQTSDIKNRDLWEDLLEIWEDYLYSGTPVSWRHIRGHGVDPNASPIHVMGNDRVDKLAVRAKKMLML
jgi:ribonuclease HI